MSSNVKIGLLVAGHIVAGLALASLVYFVTQTAFVWLLALVFAEAGLLGIWGALGTTRPSLRFPVVFATTAYLWTVLVTALQFWSMWGSWRNMGSSEGARFFAFFYFLLIALPTVVILLVLGGLRHGRRKLRLARSIALSPAVEGFQFTIRHLLLATAVVAVILGIGRGIRAFADKEWAPTLSLAIVSPCLIIVELATLWAALGIGGPRLRLAVVLPTAFMVGAIPTYYLGGLTRVDWSTFIIFGIQATITAASLLVARSCGWRLVRGPIGGTAE